MGPVLQNEWMCLYKKINNGSMNLKVDFIITMVINMNHRTSRRALSIRFSKFRSQMILLHYFLFVTRLDLSCQKASWNTIERFLIQSFLCSNLVNIMFLVYCYQGTGKFLRLCWVKNSFTGFRTGSLSRYVFLIPLEQKMPSLALLGSSQKNEIFNFQKRPEILKQTAYR